MISRKDSSQLSKLDNRAEDKWHVGKEIPIAFLVALLSQTAIFIYQGATLVAKVDQLTKQAEWQISQTEKQSELLTKSMAETTGAYKSIAILYERTDDLRRRVDILEKSPRR